MRNFGIVRLAAMTLGLAASGTAANAEWITSWTAAPQPPNPAGGPFGPSPSWENRTLRQILRVSAGGEAVRVRLTNAYGESALDIGAARIALLDDNGDEIAGTSRTLTFGGNPTARVSPGAPLLSDAVDLEVPALAKMAVSIYLPGDTGPCTCHLTGLDRLEISPPGDHSAAPFAPETVIAQRAFLAAIEVDAPDDAASVAVIGDSITDGVGSTNGADRRWPDILAARLSARGGKAWGVANLGISGNRVISGGMGESALTRLDRDILSLPGVEKLIVFEGVNDLGIGFARVEEGQQPNFFASLGGRPITADQIIDGYRQIIARAHAKGIKVYGATIAPYKGASYWSEEGEAARRAINEWIVTSGEFDGVLDFAAVLSDPADPSRMADGLHMGDFLHGSDAGYRKLAEAIDLSLFD